MSSWSLLETSDQFRDSLRSNTGDRTILGRITKRGSGLSRWQGREGHESPIEQRELKAKRGPIRPAATACQRRRSSPPKSAALSVRPATLRGLGPDLRPPLRRSRDRSRGLPIAFGTGLSALPQFNWLILPDRAMCAFMRQHRLASTLQDVHHSYLKRCRLLRSPRNVAP